MIIIDSNWAGIDAELDRLKGAPGELGLKELETALEAGKEEVKAAVHVLSGALKESTHVVSVHEGGIWEGEIRVGDGLHYAVYEQDRKGVKAETGTPHDFIEINEHLLHEQFLDAVKAAL